MAGIQLKVDVRGIREFMRLLGNMTRRMQDRRDLHARWALLAWNWVQRNFATEGGLVGGWNELSPNTLAGRRKGTGRILQDTGRLKQSFFEGLGWTSEHARIGSNVKYAEYHEKGTGPYVIRPKSDNLLSFVVATNTGIKTRTLKSGRVISMRFAEGNRVYAREVHHPGLPKRRMLPTKDDPILVRDLMKAAYEYMRQRD